VDPEGLLGWRRTMHWVKVLSFEAGLWATLTLQLTILLCSLGGVVGVVLGWQDLQQEGKGAMLADQMSGPRVGLVMGVLFLIGLPLLALACWLLFKQTLFLWRLWRNGEVKTWALDARPVEETSRRAGWMVSWADLGIGAVLVLVGGFAFTGLVADRSVLALFPGLGVGVGALMLRRAWLEWRQWQLHVSVLERYEAGD
jgi:hypothetical protein